MKNTWKTIAISGIFVLIKLDVCASTRPNLPKYSISGTSTFYVIKKKRHVHTVCAFCASTRSNPPPNDLSWPTFLVKLSLWIISPTFNWMLHGLSSRDLPSPTWPSHWGAEAARRPHQCPAEPPQPRHEDFRTFQWAAAWLTGPWAVLPWVRDALPWWPGHVAWPVLWRPGWCSRPGGAAWLGQPSRPAGPGGAVARGSSSGPAVGQTAPTAPEYQTQLQSMYRYVHVNIKTTRAVFQIRIRI